MSATLEWQESLAARWRDITDYRTAPVDWVQDKLREFLWSQQRKILESLRDNRYTAVHSAHDLGKSKVAADAISWWIDSHPPGEAFVVSTAPTAAQVSSILWREISKNMTKNHKMVAERDEKKVADWDEVDEALSEIMGKINRAGYPQWIVDGELVGYGRKPADYEESAFQGIHARYVLIVVDEACGVARHLFDAVDALATNEFARVLAIGNPDDPGSHFASICKPGSDWNVIHLDGLRSPNITKARVIGHKSDGYGYANPKYPLLAALLAGEGIPYSTEVIPEHLNDMLVSELWIEERIRRWGGISAEAHLDLSPEELQDLVMRRCAASPLFASKVRGIFPSASSTGVIPLGWVQLAVNRWHDVMDKVQYGVPGKSVNELAIRSGIRVLGVDVAGEGEDETAFAIRYGSVIEKIERYRMADTMETANAAAGHLQEIGSMAVVDTIGIGAGVYDRLREMGRDPKKTGVLGSAIPFTASKQTKRRDAIGEYRFRNDRAAAWWNLRQMLDPSRGSIIALPDDDRLIEELVAVRYKHNVGGVIQIESKEEIRKRLGRSTDTADACLVPGTLVTTNKGQIPVELILPGDFVWTRAGWQRVAHSGQTGYGKTITAELADGTVLRGTQDHPVWDGLEWRRLGDFTVGSTMSVCHQYAQNPSPTPGTPTRGTPTVNTDICPPISGVGQLENRCIERNTKRKLGLSRTTFMSIIRTAIRSIMTPQTWKRLKPSSICHITVNKWRLGLSENATGAAQTFITPGETQSASGALAIATPSLTGKIARILVKRNVRSAGTNTINTGPNFVSVLVPVLRVTESAPSEVYNLSVENQPEFIANGVLVHNCIQAFWVDGYAPEDDNPAPVYGWQDARPSDGVIRYEGYEAYGESDLTATPGDSGPGFNYAGLGSHQNGSGFDGWDL